MRRGFGLIAALGLQAGFIGTAFAVAPILPFTDLEPDASYVSAVERLAQLRIVSSRSYETSRYTGFFRPNDDVTLAELAKMAVLAARRPIPDYGVPSTISAQGTWAAPYVNAATRERFTIFKDNRVNVFRAASGYETVQTFLDAFRLTKQSATRLGILDGVNASGPTMKRGDTAVLLLRFLALVPSSTFATPVPLVTPVPSGNSTSSVAPTTPTISATHRLAAGSANMRSGAGMAFRVVRVLKGGELLTLVGQQEAWAEVQLLDGTRGFLILSSIVPIRADDAAPTSEQPTPAPSSPAPASVVETPAGSAVGTITGPVNIRVQPDITSRAIGSFPAGTLLILLDQSDEVWLHVRVPDGREGYLTRKFVKIGE